MLRKIFVGGTLVLLLTGCPGTRVGTYEAEKYNQNPLTVAIPHGLENTQALKVAEEALRGRKWTVFSKTDKEVVGKLKHRHFDATTTIKLEGENLVLYSDAIYDALQMEEATPGVPYNWLKNLQKDIQSKFGE